MSERKKRRWPWIAVPMIGLPVLYVASFGPACWLADLNVLRLWPTTVVYRPLVRAANGKSIVAGPLGAYSGNIVAWMDMLLDLHDSPWREVE